MLVGVTVKTISVRARKGVCTTVTSLSEMCNDGDLFVVNSALLITLKKSLEDRSRCDSILT